MIQEFPRRVLHGPVEPHQYPDEWNVLACLENTIDRTYAAQPERRWGDLQGGRVVAVPGRPERAALDARGAERGPA